MSDEPKISDIPDDKWKEYMEEMNTEQERRDALKAWFKCECGAQLQGYQMDDMEVCPNCGESESYQRIA